MPESFITREDMSVLVCRAIGMEESDTNLTYNDVEDISNYAKSAVYELSSRGIINGIGDNLFAPLYMANRAQAAMIIYRVISLCQG